MKLKFNGVWKQSLLRIKHLGAWRSPYRTLIKRNGVWKDDHLKGILNTLYSGTIGVGTYATTYTVVGYSAGVAGSANPTTTKFVNSVRNLVTGSKPYYNAPPYQWLEMAVEGDIRHVANQIGDITINGIYGRLVNVGVGTSGTTRTFIGWVFDRPLPTSGQWVVNT